MINSQTMIHHRAMRRRLRAECFRRRCRRRKTSAVAGPHDARSCAGSGMLGRTTFAGPPEDHPTSRFVLHGCGALMVDSTRRVNGKECDGRNTARVTLLLRLMGPTQLRQVPIIRAELSSGRRAVLAAAMQDVAGFNWKAAAVHQAAGRATPQGQRLFTPFRADGPPRKILSWSIRVQ